MVVELRIGDNAFLHYSREYFPMYRLMLCTSNVILPIQTEKAETVHF